MITWTLAICGGPAFAADMCSKDRIQKSLKGREATRADLALIERTCQQGQKQERAAEKKQAKAAQTKKTPAATGQLAVAEGGGGRTVPGGSDELAAPGGSSEIHCGHHTCTCWDGNIINGCKLAPNVCADELICVGPVCVCSAKQ